MVDRVYEFIRQELIRNQEELCNRKHYFTHAYQSNSRHLHVNVGIFKDEQQRQIAQIYVADKNNKIRERFIIENNRIIDTDIIIKRYE